MLVVAVCSSPQQAHARRFFRSRFRPGTLEIQRVGQLELEAQLGGIYGDGPDGTRLPLPDFALGLGVLPWLEIDIDTSFAQTNLGESSAQYVGEPVWVAGRFDLYNFEDKKTGSTFGVGAQVGPRLPSIHNAKGIGVGALGLVGGGTKNLHAVVNLGSTVDASQSPSINYGIDVEYEFELRHKWSLVGEVAGAHYFGADEPDVLLLNVGFGAELSDDLEVELMALTGPVFQGDRFGLVAGFTWDYDLWHEPR
ncbi:MAG: hypothetical protein RLZZ450_5108 [Pseudomonadota bacterium]